MPMLTVREQIRYHADLRLKDLTDDERSHIVRDPEIALSVQILIWRLRSLS